MNQAPLLVLLALAVVIAITSIVGCEHKPIDRQQRHASRPSAHTVEPRRTEAPDGRALLDHALANADLELVLANADRSVLDTTPCNASRKQTSCMRCTLAPSLQPPSAGEIARGLELAPPEFLKAAGVKRVVVCSDIRYLEPLGTAPIATVDMARGDIYLRTIVLNAGLREIVQHEIFHLFDRRGEADREWRGLNTKGFRYGETTVGGLGFISAYGKKNVLEDKATVYEAIMRGNFCDRAE